jgi:hypothetical protein
MSKIKVNFSLKQKIYTRDNHNIDKEKAIKHILKSFDNNEIDDEKQTF